MREASRSGFGPGSARVGNWCGVVIGAPPRVISACDLGVSRQPALTAAAHLERSARVVSMEPAARVEPRRLWGRGRPASSHPSETSGAKSGLHTVLVRAMARMSSTSAS